ncbi:MAG: F0F1 ATP synthase subunit B [Patescibacteria group bacterium]|nr:F0F1 ATP synthase subunit B [Patescibacteria group bacterium]
MELIRALGLDLKILIAQLINFAVLLFVLHRFAYKPILGMLEKRRKRIEQSLNEAVEITKKMEHTDREIKNLLAKARKQADEMINQARKQADNQKKEIMDQADKLSLELKEKTAQEIKKEKDTIIEQAKNQIAQLTVELAKKIIPAQLTAESEKQITRQSLKNLNSKYNPPN